MLSVLIAERISACELKVNVVLLLTAFCVLGGQMNSGSENY